MNCERIGIVGLGSVTGFGDGVQKLWDALIHQNLPEIEWLKTVEIPHLKKVNHSAESMAEVSIIEAIEMAQLSNLENIPIVYGWSKENVSRIFSQNIWSTPNLGMHLQNKFSSTAPAYSVNTACMTGLNAIYSGVQLLKDTQYHQCIVGAVEVKLPDLLLEAYKKMGVLSRTKSSTLKYFKPFDRYHEGFVLGEAAAFFILEKEESILRRGVKPIGWIEEVRIMNDAFHMTNMNPNGATLNQLLTKIKFKNPCYINMHGTATDVNDLIETDWLQNQRADYIFCSGTKPFTSHALGATSALEVVICLWSLKNQVMIGTPNLEEPLIKSSSLLNENKIIKFKQSVSLSYGFGGHMGVGSFVMD